MTSNASIFAPNAQKTVVNANGGKQSALPGVFYQVPAEAMRRLRRTWVRSYTHEGHVDAAFDALIALMEDHKDLDYLGIAFTHLAWAVETESDQTGIIVGTEATGYPYAAILRIAQIMDEGSKKYGRGNWRRIEYWSQIDHVVQHFTAYGMGDEEDDHLGHAMCRLAFAIAVEDPEYRFTGIDVDEPKVVFPDRLDIVGQPHHLLIAEAIRLAIKTGDRTFLSMLNEVEWKALTSDLLLQEFAARDGQLCENARLFIVPDFVAEQIEHEFGAGANVVVERDEC